MEKRTVKKIIGSYKIPVLALIILSMLMSFACGDPQTKGRVELIYDGIVYIPYEHWIFSEKDRLASDGIRLSAFALDYDPDLAKGLSALEGIKADGEFSVLMRSATGRNIDELYNCVIYDEDLKVISPNGNINDLPRGFDVIYIAFEVVWEDKNGVSGYQYIFKIIN